MTNRGVGAHGEEIAARYLQQQGCTILARNWRGHRLGEVDIVVQDGDCLVFVEVKTRRGRTFGLPEEAVTAAKQARLLTLAQLYLAEELGTQDVLWRVDVIAIELSRAGKLCRLEHFRNAVEL